MKLQELVYELESKSEVTNKNVDETIQISGLADNTSQIEAGYLFIAIKGFSKDGHTYIDEAIQKGASVIVGEADLQNPDLPYIQVKNARKALGIISSRYYNYPSRNKTLIGVTGTNGKTTTTYLVKHILASMGNSCALFGSIHNVINGVDYPSQHMTPNSLEINRMLAESQDDVVVMEVTFHALTQYRVEGLAYDLALFTNLSHNHLDYHDSMEEYFEAKKMLFDLLKRDGEAVINTDDSWGQRLADTLQEQGTSTYRIGEMSGSDFRMVESNFNPPRVKVQEKNEVTAIDSNMYGAHNMYNVTMAYAAAKVLGWNQAEILSSIRNFEGVKGRFQIITRHEVNFVIDYAHTPDAIFHCLNTAKQGGAENVIHVFGFRGDRDRTKRREMMAITSELSDHYILTFDDLNSVSKEDMEKELQHLQKEHGNEKGRIVTDRTKAIKQAMELAEADDWVLITGKGNEAYQNRYDLPAESDEEMIKSLSYQP
ncbi:UDP-N-acetylmuramoyl-L-alanyl-D-glutamate--2,6-diaminopimelate ligase [Halobacillus halophilus]|uniref:UDP-N-acetylmuramoyl-L-alanyl-D-glutamate--2, 6-diaminopimelate ligase n=1 Tax=Halobacillus halophilus TaxID=1570 RepID=UPI001CD3082E|nr:UDP-N-acetylmuramoyl-L-alanyl-D-glutamate--2,6-diaminopimelate ligase [Halobacillus halophilus]MCA1010764.1 UDP-N-acetylmuramoyl-L-alanyl-D-glutamate--2,6-diaminopimelate ligase [Halobacillus halophilus]